MQSACRPNCGHGKETRTAKADQLGHLQDRRQADMGRHHRGAPDEAAAIEKAAKEFHQHPAKMATLK
jgi:hypothetical protein